MKLRDIIRRSVGIGAEPKREHRSTVVWRGPGGSTLERTGAPAGPVLKSVAQPTANFGRNYCPSEPVLRSSIRDAVRFSVGLPPVQQLAIHVSPVRSARQSRALVTRAVGQAVGAIDRLGRALGGPVQACHINAVAGACAIDAFNRQAQVHQASHRQPQRPSRQRGRHLNAVDLERLDRLDRLKDAVIARSECERRLV